METLRHWRTLRWYLLLLAPHLAADVYLGIRLHDPVLALVTIAISLLLVTVIVVEIQSGLTSSNWGTYTRTHHPFRYWAFVCTKCVLYLGMIVVTLQTAHPTSEPPAPAKSIKPSVMA